MPDIIDQGTGPVLVFLHRAGVDNMLWEPQISAFAKGARVIAPNLPGHGRVPPVQSVTAMADHAHAYLDQQGIDRYALIGLSLGGMVALDIAGRWPQEVTHLAMIEAVPYVAEAGIRMTLLKIALWFSSLISPRILIRLPDRQLGAQTARAGAYLKAKLRQTTAAGNYALVRAALVYDGRTHFSVITMPSLLLVGEKNKATHAHAKEMADAVPNSIFQIIPNAGHIANLDAPDIVNNAIRSLVLTPGAA